MLDLEAMKRSAEYIHTEFNVFLEALSQDRFDWEEVEDAPSENAWYYKDELRRLRNRITSTEIWDKGGYLEYWDSSLHAILRENEFTGYLWIENDFLSEIDEIHCKYHKEAGRREAILRMVVLGQ